MTAPCQAGRAVSQGARCATILIDARDLRTSSTGFLALWECGVHARHLGHLLMDVTQAVSMHCDEPDSGECRGE